jgi:exodeoxyribonuclease V beta subunit
MERILCEKPEELLRLQDGHAVIEASAGTGKTYLLEHLVVDLLLSQGARIENLLIVTFTEKATYELAARLRRKLWELRHLTRGAPPSTPRERCWVLDEPTRRRLEEALFSFDRATLCTIHAFCERVLLDHAFSSQRLFEESAVDEERAFDSAFRETLREELARDEELRPYLRAWLAVRDPDRLKSLLFQCHKAHAPLSPPYDPEALCRAIKEFRAVAGELPLLFDELRRAGVHAGTVKAVAARAARLAVLCAEAEDLPALLWAAEEAAPILNKGLQALHEGLRARSSRLSPAVEPVRRAALGLTAALVPLSAAVAQLFLPVVRARLSARKRRAGELDFHDMLALVADALDGPQGPALAEALRARYHCALIDEFQDTDEVQWRIFERLFFSAEPRRRVFVIGDPKQAIYGFRGADVRTYLAAKRRILAGGGARLSLRRSFRQTERLIEALNRIFDPAGGFFTGSIHYDEPVTCGRPTRRALDGTGNEPTPVHLFRIWPRDEARQMPVLQVRRTLAARIAAEIRALLAGGFSFGEQGEEAPLRPKDIFVLTRTVFEGYEVGSALRAAGIAHAYYKQDGLFETEEAGAVRDLLAAIDDPRDRSRRYKAWITPFFGVPLEEVGACADLSGTHPLLARLLRWKGLADAMRYEQLFAAILEESGVARRWIFRGDERALTNTTHLFELLLDEATRRRCTLRELLSTLDAWIAERERPEDEGGGVQRLESEREAVQVMTMHKSKGLEAAVVFLYGGFSAAAPSEVRAYHEGDVRTLSVGKPREEVRAAAEREAQEEAERLLYVALTRAKARLYLPYIPEITVGGAVKDACRLTGGYRALNAVLRRLLGTPSPLFSIEEVSWRERQRESAGESAAVTGWSPSQSSLPAEVRADELNRLRDRHAGFFVTSYTRMKESLRHRAVEREDLAGEPEGAPVALPDDELPGGSASGIFLHELLERVDVRTFAEAPSLEAWRRLPATSELFRSTAQARDIDPRHLPHSEALVHAAFRSPLRLGDAWLASGLCGATRLLREMEFLYPFPEPSHPPLGALAEGLRIERGFIQGFVDAVFEHEGLVYFADWKSDVLPAWDAAFVAGHVRASYELQERLYALALVKMLGIRSAGEYRDRFGGIFYGFVRAMRLEGDGRGVHFERPDWDRILSWEEELRRGPTRSAT